MVKRKFFQGYTLIEVMVVVGIVSILALGGMAAYNRFNDRQQLVQAVDGFVTTFREVQKQADAGDLAGVCDELGGYQMILTNNSSAYRVDVICSPSGSQTIVNNTLASGATFQSAVTITFWPLGEALSLAPPNPLEIRSVSGEYKIVITITSGGAISRGEVEVV